MAVIVLVIMVAMLLQMVVMELPIQLLAHQPITLAVAGEVAMLVLVAQVAQVD